MTHIPDTTKMVPAMEPGYEIATEWREGLRYTNLSIPNHGWHDANEKQVIPQPGIIFAAPICLRLGENYLDRDGKETGQLTKNIGTFRSTHPFWSVLLERSFRKNGRYLSDKTDSNEDIVSRIPKKQGNKLVGDDGKPLSHWNKIAISAHKETREKEEKKMESPKYDGMVIECNTFKPLENGKALLSSYEVARLLANHPEFGNDVQDEVKRIQEERYIVGGDWCFVGTRFHIEKCAQVLADGRLSFPSNIYDRSDCTKIPGPPEIIAFLEAGVKGEVKP